MFMLTCYFRMQGFTDKGFFKIPFERDYVRLGFEDNEMKILFVNIKFLLYVY